MIFRSCCFCGCLRRGCFFIAIICILYYSLECVIFGPNSIFINMKPIGPAYFVQIGIIFFALVGSLLLIVATRKEEKDLVLPWLFIFAGILVLYVILLIVDLIHIESKGIVIAEVVVIIIIVYFWCIVHSYYQELTLDGPHAKHARDLRRSTEVL